MNVAAHERRQVCRDEHAIHLAIDETWNADADGLDVGRDIAQLCDGACNLRDHLIAFEQRLAAFDHLAFIRNERSVHRRAGEVNANKVCY